MFSSWKAFLKTPPSHPIFGRPGNDDGPLPSFTNFRYYLSERAASAEEAVPVLRPNGEGGVASSTSKKKVALLISYWGNNYQGLQM